MIRKLKLNHMMMINL